jgi:rRNA-processing protein FCF1
MANEYFEEFGSIKSTTRTSNMKNKKFHFLRLKRNHKIVTLKNLINQMPEKSNILVAASDEGYLKNEIKNLGVNVSKINSRDSLQSQWEKMTEFEGLKDGKNILLVDPVNTF